MMVESTPEFSHPISAMSQLWTEGSWMRGWLFSTFIHLSSGDSMYRLPWNAIRLRLMTDPQRCNTLATLADRVPVTNHNHNPETKRLTPAVVCSAADCGARGMRLVCSHPWQVGGRIFGRSCPCECSSRAASNSSSCTLKIVAFRTT